MAVLSTDGKTINGHVINFISCDEPSYPQLTRLYLEYDFRIIEITRIDNEDQPEHQFTMVYKNRHTGSAQVVTPVFSSLSELEKHTDENVIDILQKTVFDSTLSAQNKM